MKTGYKDVKIDITMPSVIRPALLEGTLQTIVKNVVDNIDRFRLIINVDPIGEKIKPGKPINSETEYKMRLWEELYDRSEFDNDTYCNPESNCLMILDIPGRKNILDLMKNRKVCIITARPEIKCMLPNVDIVPIVGQYKNQYKNSFPKVIDYIEHTARDYDFWLVAAGELGRIYSGLIKEQGGRCLDIGFVIEFWLDGFLHPRLHLFVGKTIDNNFTIRLTQEGKKYEKFI